MVGWTDRRMGGWKLARRVGACAAVLLSAHPPIHLSAQIGHDPGHSPYRDIRRGVTLGVYAGYFGGSRGSIPVGPSYGPTGGLRFRYSVSGFLSLTADVAYAQTDAYYFNPNDSNPQKKGPINNDLVFMNFGLQASLTGGKTYHNLQPYVGAAFGFAFGTTIGADSSGYRFGTKFTYAPEAGVRWYPTRRLSVDLGARLQRYRLVYPLSYRPKLIAVFDKLIEGTSHPWATFGVGWTF